MGSARIYLPFLRNQTAVLAGNVTVSFDDDGNSDAIDDEVADSILASHPSGRRLDASGKQEAPGNPSAASAPLAPSAPHGEPPPAPPKGPAPGSPTAPAPQTPVVSAPSTPDHTSAPAAPGPPPDMVPQGGHPNTNGPATGDTDADIASQQTGGDKSTLQDRILKSRGAGAK